MFNFFNKFQSKKPLNPDSDLISEFLETDSEFTQNRQNYYLKFKAKNKQEKPTFKFILQQNLLWASCFLVTIVSFVGGVNLQAQQSSSQPFITNDQQRVVRFESCNVDMALPKKIDGVNTFLTAYKNSEFNEDDGQIFFIPKELKLAKATDPTGVLGQNKFNNDYSEITLNCFSKSEYTNYQKFVSQINSKQKQFESVFETKNITNKEANNLFKWQILNESKVQNIQLKTLKESQDFNTSVEDPNKEGFSYMYDQFMILQFELNDQIYTIESKYSNFNNQKDSGTDKVESYLKQIDLKPIQSNQTDFQKIEFDEYGNYYEYGVSQDQLSFFDDLLSRIYSTELFNLLNILFLMAFLASSLFFFVFVNKKINQNKLKLESRIGLYAVFINSLCLLAIFINSFLTGYSSENAYRGEMLAITVFSQFGILLLDIIINFRKSNKKENLVKIAFLIAGLFLIASNFLSFIFTYLQTDNFYLWFFYCLLVASVNFAIPVWWLLVFGMNLKKSLPSIVSVLSKEKSGK